MTGTSAVRYSVANGVPLDPLRTMLTNAKIAYVGRTHE